MFDSTTPRSPHPRLRRSARASTAVLVALALGALSACQAQPQPNGFTARSAWRQTFTHSPAVVINDDGGWSWFADPRTIITPAGRLMAGSVATGSGRSGRIEVSSAYVGDGLTSNDAIRRATLDGYPRGADDHNNPSLAANDNGSVTATWSAHGADNYVRTTTDNGSGAFGTKATMIERPDASTPPGRGVSYGSTIALTDVGVTFIAYRGEDYTWNLLRSRDGGRRWEALGAIVAPARYGDRPYMKFATDGRRLWFATTERHPNVEEGRGPTNVRVGYVDPSGGVHTKDHKNLGTVGQGGRGVPVGSVPLAYETPANAMSWVSDIAVVEGRPVVAVTLLAGRRPEGPTGAYNHVYIRAMPNRSTGQWMKERVSLGGTQLGRPGTQTSWTSEPSYSGLAAIDPSTPNRWVVSTNVDPWTDKPLLGRDGRQHFNVFEMYRNDDGTWRGVNLTPGSSADNIRPHIAVRGTMKVVTWMQGEYLNPFQYHTRLVAKMAK